MEESAKSSEENKIMEAERPKCEKEIQNGSDRKRNTWRTTKLAMLADKVQSIARMELGETSGKANTSIKRETWWWNQEVLEKLKNKKKAKKVWDTTRDDVSKLAYKTARNKIKEKWQRLGTRSTKD